MTKKVRSFDEKKREREALDALEAEAVGQVEESRRLLIATIEDAFPSMSNIIVVGCDEGGVRMIAGLELTDRLKVLGILEEAKLALWGGGEI